MHDVLDKVNKNTKDFEVKYPKNIRKERCQFFTPINIAVFMASAFHTKNKEIKILDPCGGTGVLSVAILDKILNEKQISSVKLDIYEVDDCVVDILKKNIKLIETRFKHKNVSLNVNIYNENFITKVNEESCIREYYDLVIANPPYKKISKISEEAMFMEEIVFGQPNLYMLFMAQGCKMLKDSGQMVCIVPRSFFNGKYFTKFRIWLFKNFSITYIHSFNSRSKIINDEVLQELVIVKIVKENKKEVIITCSENDKDISSDKKIVLSSSMLWENKDERKIRLPISEEDINLIKKFDSMSSTFEKLGFKFSTGPVVDFRVTEGLLQRGTKNTVPLLWCANFGNVFLNWPLKNTKYKQHIDFNKNRRILLTKSNYVLIKRFSSKEEGKKLKINIVEVEKFNYEYLGLENHLNYLRINDNSTGVMKGIYILLNSNMYNKYFNIINGTTQINSFDLNSLPCPSIKKINELAAVDVAYEDLVSEKCDEILNLIL